MAFFNLSIPFNSNHFIDSLMPFSKTEFVNLRPHLSLYLSIFIHNHTLAHPTSVVLEIGESLILISSRSPNLNFLPFILSFSSTNLLLPSNLSRPSFFFLIDRIYSILLYSIDSTIPHHRFQKRKKVYQ